MQRHLLSYRTGAELKGFSCSRQFHVLIAQAMMSHSKVNPLTRWLSHRNKSRFHAILQIVGGSMVLLGSLE